MKPGIQRSVAHRLCGALRVVLPQRLRGWADALQSELADIAHDGEALRFVLGGCCGLMPRALLAHLEKALFAVSGSDHGIRESSPKGSATGLDHHPRAVGVLSAIVAVGLGLAYLAAAGAPTAYLLMNLGTLCLGLTILVLTVRLSPLPARWAGIGALAVALILLATSIFGSSIEGAARWFAFGPLFVQSSLLFVPWMILRFARRPNLLSTTAMVVAALALALQPDRAMAGVLLAGLVTLALFSFNRAIAVALASAALAFLVTLLRPDRLPAVPYVDQILFSAFQVHPLAGVGIWVGAALLLAPAMAGRRGNAGERRPAVIFGSVWSAILLAAALGNYPTPLVGYGGSAILGYLLCLPALPRSLVFCSQIEPGRADANEQPPPGRFFRWLSLPAPSVFIFGMSSAAGQRVSKDCVRARV